ncbi:MAG TPA: methyltransferase domain-containing protein [Verrucomicrobia bacterium]|nr:methyltransferase domain-containing protein [Verrucomicrobiota bacterium]HOB32582.1 methyltransferase domain-containing protein [Verrucomicrobiota bacterium]HOP96981.1 methyltransferase domain-containing protein [Verrucomicrobiota bacterium]HPU55628.1 methyltransferase domain-containing protein [Verrucomicrobiota bacterium]
MKFLWDPADYAAHSSSQRAWARELMARLRLRGTERILDVGCGDGKVTAELAAAVPSGRVVGIDSSAEMIAFAAAAFSTQRNLAFRVMDATRIAFDETFDIVFSNAALHWVEDHPAFLAGASRVLKPGGRLMVSCGGKGNANDVFLVLRGRMRAAHWRKHFRNVKAPYFFYSPEEYGEWLPRFGFEPRAVRLVPKQVTFPDREAFTGWFRTTWLPYTQRVPEPERAEFIQEVVDAYLSRHPADPSGIVSVGMVRLEISAIRRPGQPATEFG